MHTLTHIHSTDKGDDLIAYMARVSNPDNQNNTDTSARLIKYLIKHKHWSPFEMVNMCVCIETTRSVAQQIIRHRSFSFQEFSQRYAQVTKKSWLPDLRRQDTKNRQNSIDDVSLATVAYFHSKIEQCYENCFDVYEKMIAAGIAKECAREVLPLSTPTTLYMNGSLRSWLHYCDLRCDAGTQLEHRIIADQAKEQIKLYFPMVYEAWSDAM
jgi:thymidylate synthase (FAD)